MSDYSSVLTYTINRGVAIGTGSIMLSQSGVVDVCLLGTPIQACSPKNPKCEGRTETFYSVLDNSLNQMFVTDERGWAYITSGGRLANVINGDQLAAVPGDREAAIGEVAVLGGQSDVQTYGINRGVSVLRNTISLCTTNFNIKAPIVKQVLACTKDNPKCEKQSVYYQFFNSFNKSLFITDQEGYEIINPSKDAGDIVKQL
jgi:hypothetical protein